MRVRAAFTATMFIAMSLIFDLILRAEAEMPFGFIFGGVTVLAALAVTIMPARRFRAWGYARDPEELLIKFGVWTKVETVVPLFRVQHIDIGQGPIERLFSVNRLVIHTAGTQHSRVVLPGLSRETAETLRDEIRARVGREAP
jgi:membrane protein YdbS with pleckstrin-like domain